MKRLIAFLIALLPVTMLAPLASSASTTCNNGFCTQIFYFTGSTQQFEVPEGVTTIRFEVSGASGARGGAGGRVTGSLTNLPETLLIEVGQAGNFGSNREGGYNGGGASGGSNGNEGSGGGASDIRLTNELQSRIVVAGGGGGGGGGASAPGAPGGDVIAASGTSGQGLAGSGGTQLQGGAGGSNAGSGQQPSEGSFGQGGSGGSGLAAGGGGGGGGWYGGGGGGGDDTVGGPDGSGGGGGSSYASPDYTSNVVHRAGAQWGHGRIHIHYQLPTQVVSFTGEQAAFGQIKYQILFDQSAQDLNPDDFSFDRADCSIWRISLNDNLAEVTLSGCGGEAVTLTLRENAVGLETFGPTQPVSATVLIDRTGPSFAWSESSLTTSASEIALDFSLSDAIVAQRSSFEVSGCDLEIVESRAMLSSCSEGVNSVTFKSLSTQDSWGNLGPSFDRTATVVVDRTAPSASWSDIRVSGDGPFTYSTTISFSEAVQWTSSAVSFSSDVDCETGSSDHEFWAVCDYGNIAWSFDSSTLYDQALNYGSGSVVQSFSHTRPLPPEPTRSEVVSIVAPVQPAPQPEPAPAPEPAPEPAPAPAGPAIVIPPVVEPLPPVDIAPETTSPELETQEPEALPDLDYLMPLEEGIGGLVNIINTVRPLPQTNARESTSEPEVIEVLTQSPTASKELPVVESATEEPQAEAVSGPGVEFESRSEFPWLMAIAAGLVLLLGLGVWRFSGR